MRWGAPRKQQPEAEAQFYSVTLFAGLKSPKVRRRTGNQHKPDGF